jgi:hypothetical protein
MTVTMRKTNPSPKALPAAAQPSAAPPIEVRPGRRTVKAETVAVAVVAAGEAVVTAVGPARINR